MPETRRIPLPRWKRALFVAVTTTLFLAAAEIAATHYLPPLDLPAMGLTNLPSWTKCHRWSEEIGFEAIPGECGFNEYGAKVIAAPSRSANPRRMLLIGDSVSEGGGYVGEAQALLDDDPGPRGWEIWNAAVSAYNFPEELFTLKKRVPQVRPDLVLWQVCPNDAYMTARVVYFDDVVRRWLLTPDGRLRTWFAALRGSRIAQYGIFFGLGKRSPNAVRKWSYSLPGLLQDARAFLAERRVPIAFLVFPNFGPGQGGTTVCETAARRVAAAVVGSGMPYYLAQDALEKPLTRYRVGDDCVHPSREAHARVARGAVEYLRANAFFQGPSASR